MRQQFCFNLKPWREHGAVVKRKEAFGIQMIFYQRKAQLGLCRTKRQYCRSLFVEDMIGGMAKPVTLSHYFNFNYFNFYFKLTLSFLVLFCLTQRLFFFFLKDFSFGYLFGAELSQKDVNDVVEEWCNSWDATGLQSQREDRQTPTEHPLFQRRCFVSQTYHKYHNTHHGAVVYDKKQTHAWFAPHKALFCSSLNERVGISTFPMCHEWRTVPSGGTTWIKSYLWDYSQLLKFSWSSLVISFPQQMLQFLHLIRWA